MLHLAVYTPVKLYACNIKTVGLSPQEFVCNKLANIGHQVVERLDRVKTAGKNEGKNVGWNFQRSNAVSIGIRPKM